VLLQLGEAAGDLTTANFLQALKTKVHKIKVAAKETTEQELCALWTLLPTPMFAYGR
jgi:hypothetical protein